MTGRRWTMLGDVLPALLLCGALLLLYGLIASWSIPFEKAGWQNDPSVRLRMVRDLVENQLYAGMTEEAVCDLLGQDVRGRCDKLARPAHRKDSQWRVGMTRAALAPWIKDGEDLVIIFDEDRRVVHWTLVHELPELWRPTTWYLPG